MLQFPIAMTPRTEPARALAWLSPVIAFALTVFTGFCLFAALGQDPVKALGVFFIAPLDSLRGWTEIAVKMTPLLLCAAGLVVCFKANVWNIGAEGQLIAGAITGGVVALACDPSWGRWYVVLVMLASAVGGAVWGGFTALLRHRFHANEILVSLMLVYVAQFLLAWCVQGPMRDPMGFGFPQTKLFETGAMLPVLEGTRLHAGALLALFSAVGVWLLMDRMALGFQFKVSGMAPFAARYAGYHPGKLIWASMLIAGRLLVWLAASKPPVLLVSSHRLFLRGMDLRPSLWPSSGVSRRLAVFPQLLSWHSFILAANWRRAVWGCRVRSRACIRDSFSFSFSLATR